MPLEPSFQINIYQGIGIPRCYLSLLGFDIQTTLCDLVFAKLFILPVTRNTWPFPSTSSYPLPPCFNSTSFAQRALFRFLHLANSYSFFKSQLQISPARKAILCPRGRIRCSQSNPYNLLLQQPTYWVATAVLSPRRPDTETGGTSAMIPSPILMKMFANQSLSPGEASEFIPTQPSRYQWVRSATQVKTLYYFTVSLRSEAMPRSPLYWQAYQNIWHRINTIMSVEWMTLFTGDLAFRK